MTRPGTICDGSSECVARVHIHGCFADRGNCDRKHAHVFSVFGLWCYLCGHRKRWWRFWETWVDEEHDEPF